MTASRQTDSPRLETKWSTGVIIRYVLLQIPGFVLLTVVLLLLHSWFNLSLTVMFILLAVWAVKDIILFPFVWKAYAPAGLFAAGERLVGERGYAVENLDPTGYVRIKHELWRARIPDGHPPISPDSPVIVEEQHGLTLIVTAARPDPAN